MALTQEQKDFIELEYARKELGLTPDDLHNEKAIEAAFEKKQTELNKELAELKLSETRHTEATEELKEARDTLLLQAQNVRKNINMQTLQESQGPETAMVADDAGRLVEINIVSAVQDIHNLPPNGLFLLPKFTMQGGGAQHVNQKDAQELITQSAKEAARLVADKNGIPIKPELNSNKMGQVCFTASQNLDQKQKQQLQQAFEKQLLTQITLNSKATLTQQTQQQQAQQKSGMSPFSTTPPIRK